MIKIQMYTMIKKELKTEGHRVIKFFFANMTFKKDFSSMSIS